MKRLYQIILLCVLLPVGVYAQDTTAFTLKEAITYALENSNDIKNAQIDEQIASARVKETRGIGLPQIDGTAQVVHNPKLSRFFTIYDPNSPFAADPPPGTQMGDILAAENFFQLQSSGDANITASQLLFNSSYLVGLKAASTYRELSQKAAQQTQQQIVENVSKAYFAAVINKERINLFDNNIARLDSIYKTTKAMFENGFVESIDVDRIEVSRNNLIIERNKFLRLQGLTYELLKFQMNFPMDKKIGIKDGLASINVTEPIEKLDEDWNYSSRIEYSMLETNKRLQELSIKNEYSASLPSLVAFGTLGWSTQSDGIGGVFKSNTKFTSDNATTNPRGYGVDKWYSYTRIGVTLNVPIFSGLQRTYRVQQARLSLRKIENNFSTVKNAIDLEKEQSRITYDNALQTMDAQRKNMALAENVARVTKIKYKEGVGSNLEVTDAESALREAQINYYDTLYEAVVSYIDLLNAYGKIESLKAE